MTRITKRKEITRLIILKESVPFDDTLLFWKKSSVSREARIMLVKISTLIMELTNLRYLMSILILF